MTSFGPNSHVFIIRARLEPREIAEAPPEWRFWVEHHPGGEQRNLRDFESVLAFIKHHVPALDLTPEPRDQGRRAPPTSVDIRSEG